MINTVTAPTYWPTNNVTNTPAYLYLFIPLNSAFRSSNSSCTRTAVYFIKQSYIKDLFLSSQTNLEENILLLNSDMELLSHLTTHASEEYTTDIYEYLRTHLPSSTTDVQYLEYDDSLIFVSRSQKSGFYYVRFLPKSAAYASLIQTRNFTFGILVLVIIIGLLLIIGGMFRNYLPIHALADWVRKEDASIADIPNEISLFRQAFDNVSQENRHLAQTIEDSRQGLINHLFTALIQNNFSTEEAFRNACHNLQISLDKPWFCVCSLIIEEKLYQTRTVDIERIINLIQNELPEGLSFQVKDLLFVGKLLLLLNSDSDEPALRQNFLIAVKDRLFEEEGLLISIGMGSCYDSYEQVGKSYLESVNALDYRLIYGKNCLITPALCAGQELERQYPTEELNTLYTALMSQDVNGAISAISRIKEFIKTQNCSIHYAKYICFDALAIIKKIPPFSGLGYNSKLSQSLDIIQLSTFETIDEFFLSYQKVIKSFIGRDDPKNNPSDSDITQQMRDYIHAHYCSYDFQVGSMAEYFSISPQYMRRLFKNHFGIGISEYVSQLKQEKAMELLRNTEMGLQDIVNEIGNSDVSGFVRSFKRKTGLTPGQYRSANRR